MWPWPADGAGLSMSETGDAAGTVADEVGGLGVQVDVVPRLFDAYKSAHKRSTPPVKAERKLFNPSKPHS